MKFRATADVDYIMGHLRYGHLEGVVEANSEKELKEKFNNTDFKDFLDLVVDDYEVEDWGDVGRFKYEVIE